MSTKPLKEALKNCLINFNCRVQVTDLLQQFKLSYEDVNKTLEEHLSEQEADGVKYEKRFLVQGLEADTKTQIYTVVNGEKNMRDWLQRLQGAEAALYSVEVDGGSKSPAVDFKPLEYHAIKLKHLEVRAAVSQKPTVTLTNGSEAGVSNSNKNIKIEPKQENKKVSPMAAFTKKTTAAESSTKAATANKISPKKEKPTPEKRKTSPEDKKPKVATTSKKGINNFFTPATTKAAETKTVDSTKNQKTATVPSSPKQMKDFFKKQAQKPKAAGAATITKTSESEEKLPITKKAVSKKTPNPNESVQLFAAESDSEVDVSSDEEEKLEALRRDIITADIQVEEKPSSSSAKKGKRRRVISSDEDEEPQQKMEKREKTPAATTKESEIVDITASDETSEPQSETFLDADGFLITIKPKKKGAAASLSVKSNKSPVRKSPRKSPVKAAAATKAKATAKTKQGNIMNFFNKK